MKETPILFCADMVRADIEGRKTQTRRVIKGLKVDVLTTVRADVPGYGSVKPGRYKAWMNERGAVSVLLPNRNLLGVKPGEFNFVCPYCDGTTELTSDGWRIVARDSWIWGRETFLNNALEGYPDVYFYKADGSEHPEDRHWKPSIYMPRVASRIRHEVLNVRIQHIQDITPEDCRAEGMPKDNNDVGVKYCYGQLWNKINEKRGYSWESNPWVWAITYKNP